ncbi:hypothetical protein [Niallia taxi]|uniref:Uncharacterized protein n=1 Tax=Niallia taxi TaxID=2499688 RepID=A0A3S3SJK9_9BACI|nr:hypothetical protein [Niallia taxi]RVT61385.1 hypothetical protein EM808_14075 [Niallia taxi]
MKNNKEIKLFDSKLFIANNKLLFGGNVVYDFEERYHNISSFGLENQIQVFNQLINSLNEVNLSNSTKAETILVFSQILRNLSKKNIKSSLLTIGDSLFSTTYARLISLFGSEHQLYEVIHTKNLAEKPPENMTSLFVNEDFNMEFLAENYFSLILINFDSVNNQIETVFAESIRIIGKYGNIIGYGSDLQQLERISGYLSDDIDIYKLDSHRYVININISSDTSVKNGVTEQIFDFIELRNREIFSFLQFIMSQRPNSKNNEWYRVIDQAIDNMAQIETIISENHMFFDNKDLVFHTNEVKNALLDFKYEAFLNRKHYDFFQSNLYDCYNDWVEMFSIESKNFTGANL